jgi:archaellum biogenesis ATPase FlaH
MTTKTYNEADLKALFPEGKPEPGGWVTHCVMPGHTDANPSMVIFYDGGNAHCRSGCNDSEVTRLVGERLRGAKPTGKKKVEAKTRAPHVFRYSPDQLTKAEAILEKSPEAQAYLAERGIDIKTARALHIGCEQHTFYKEGKPIHTGLAIVLPYCDDAGKLCAGKFRSITGKHFEKTSRDEGKYWLYNRNAITIAVLTGVLYITESELDAAAMTAHGFAACSLDSANHKLNAADLEALKQVPLIVLALDNDRAGHKAAEELLAVLTPRRAISLNIQGVKDVGDIYAREPGKFANEVRKLTRAAQMSREFFTLDDLMTEGELLAEIGGTLLYAIDRLAPLGRLLMLFGREKVGKSIIALYWGKCVANGRSVFGCYKTRKMPVLYLDYEDGITPDYVRWMQNLGPEPVRYLNNITGVPAIDSPALLEFCEKERPLIIIDSLHKLAELGKVSNAGASAEMTPVIAAVRNLCRAGATVILLHHATKANEETYRDSTTIGANVDFQIAAVSNSQPGDDVTRVKLVGKPGRGPTPPTLNLVTFPALPNIGQVALEDNPHDRQGKDA